MKQKKDLMSLSLPVKTPFLFWKSINRYGFINLISSRPQIPKKRGEYKIWSSSFPDSLFGIMPQAPEFLRRKDWQVKAIVAFVIFSFFFAFCIFQFVRFDSVSCDFPSFVVVDLSRHYPSLSLCLCLSLL